MKLSVSNIAWTSADDGEMYGYLKELGFAGLEIAPTRIFPDSPYDKLPEAGKFAGYLKTEYSLKISSMQSVLYGVTENIFTSEASREFLSGYMRKAILFARETGCGNIVFGCPKNRNMPDKSQYETQYGIAVDFFRDLGEYARKNDTVLAIEPNPVIYGTNFINTTAGAFKFVKDISSDGCMVNVDLGTIIYNGEDLQTVSDNIGFVNHIHISEPNLEKIKKREIHRELKALNYKNYVSIEMKNTGNINDIKETLEYIASL